MNFALSEQKVNSANSNCLLQGNNAPPWATTPTDETFPYSILFSTNPLLGEAIEWEFNLISPIPASYLVGAMSEAAFLLKSKVNNQSGSNTTHRSPFSSTKSIIST